ncbi:MAG: Uma2 family endonuclease [Sphingomonadaceae bacterium]
MTTFTKIDTSPVSLRFDVQRFRRMSDEGLLDDFAKTELIEGEIFVVNAQFRRHAWARRQLMRAFDEALAGREDGLTATDECSLDLSPNSMPQPDIVLTTEPIGDGPIPLASVRLVVEIADSTLQSDLGRKAPLYAAHDISEYWVVDLVGRLIHQMWQPEHGKYQKDQPITYGETIVAATVEAVAIDTAVLT